MKLFICSLVAAVALSGCLEPSPGETKPTDAKSIVKDKKMVYALVWVLPAVVQDGCAIEAKFKEKNAAPCKPLTDEELRNVLRQCPHDTVENLRVRWLYAKDFARAIEAAHGIKE